MYSLHKTGGPASPSHAQDHWIEAYLEVLERWRVEHKAGETVRDHLGRAWRFYGEYRRTADLHYRYLAWASIQKSAAALPVIAHQMA